MPDASWLKGHWVSILTEQGNVAKRLTDVNARHLIEQKGGLVESGSQMINGL